MKLILQIQLSFPFYITGLFYVLLENMVWKLEGMNQWWHKRKVHLETIEFTWRRLMLILWTGRRMLQRPRFPYLGNIAHELIHILPISDITYTPPQYFCPPPHEVRKRKYPNGLTRELMRIFVKDDGNWQIITTIVCELSREIAILKSWSIAISKFQLREVGINIIKAGDSRATRTLVFISTWLMDTLVTLKLKHYHH